MNMNVSWLHSITWKKSSASKVCRIPRLRISWAAISMIRKLASCRSEWWIDCGYRSGRLRSTHRPTRSTWGRNASPRFNCCSIRPRKWTSLLVRPIRTLRLRIGPNSPSSHTSHSMTRSSCMRLLRVGNAVSILSWVRRSGLWLMQPSKKCNSTHSISKLTARKRPLIASRPPHTF